MERFDAAAARRDQEKRGAQMLCRAFALGGDAIRAREVARSQRESWGGYDPDRLIDAAQQSSAFERITRAAVTAVDFDPLDLGPLQYLMRRIAEASVVGRLVRAVRVPFTRATGVQVLGVAAGFVGEGMSLPVARSEFSAIVHRPFVVGAMVVATLDSRRDTPNAEAILEAELVRAAGEAIDAKFASADAETSIAPAGIAQDASAVASTGATVAAISNDLSAMVDVPADANLFVGALVWLLSARANSYLRLLGVMSEDGTLAGFPVLSSAGISGVTLLASDRLALSLSDEVSLSASDHGDIEMDDAPSGSGTRVSLLRDLADVRHETGEAIN